jgi:hypothetical protein
MDHALAQLENIPVLKDVTFWHLLAVVTCGLLGKMVNKYFEKTEKTLEQVTALLNEVVASNKIQEFRLDNHEKRLEKLEGD